MGKTVGIRIFSLNIQDGGVLDTKKYDERYKKRQKNYGVLYENNKWNKDIISKVKPERKARDIENNIRKLIATIEKLNVQIVALQEFQYQYIDLYKKELEALGFNYFEYCSSLKDYIARNGVLIASKIEIERINKNENWRNNIYDRRDFIEIEIKQFQMSVLVVHVPASGYNLEGRRRYFKNKIVEFGSVHKNKKSIIIGDFNAATNNDRAKDCENYDALQENQKLIQDICNEGYKDAWREKNPLPNKEYTWFNDNNKLDGRRLDYAFISREIELEFSKHLHDVNTTLDRDGVSDHSAILIELKL